MRRTLTLFVLILAGSIGSAQAATITFEDLTLDTAGAGGDRTSGGFFFDTAFDHSHIDNGTWGTTNGTQFMMIDNVAALATPGNNNTTTFAPTSGAPFTLTSIDVSEAGNQGTMARLVQVTGNLFGGGTVSTLFVLDSNLIDGTTANYFQTFLLGPSWTNLSSVSLTGLGGQCCGDPAGNYFAIDNIVVDVGRTPVPEPGTLSLLGLGSTCLIARLRRKQR